MQKQSKNWPGVQYPLNEKIKIKEVKLSKRSNKQQESSKVRRTPPNLISGIAVLFVIDIFYLFTKKSHKDESLLE